MMSPSIQIINTSEAGISHLASWPGPHLQRHLMWALGFLTHLLGGGLPAALPQNIPGHREAPPLSPLSPGEALEGVWREYREAGPSDELDTVGFGRQITQGDFKALGCLNAHIFWDHGFWVTLESAGCPEPTH